ncbi:uncharacterized protein LOC128211905 isoform X2 [Mya arenaria]|uniref:uncharacterized protein LOC128211905 isoform X2 n=1 Tax=Mya arenaria TaxID=6604 RepID=UPI0022E1F6DF|nr:uncharacterized protein LOC128211905 isoform X2 [Mya arenaria]
MDEHLAFNGKAGKLDERVFSKLKLLCRPVKAAHDNAQQGNETTLVSQDDVPLYNTRLVIRTVEKPWAGDLPAEEIENNLEQRILHYAIVPQVAYYRNEQGGNLDEVIQKEREKAAEIATERPSERKPEIAAERPQTLKWKDKLRILYQICRAIEYLNQPPKCERKPVSHGNICMQNVLLDEQKNARLLFLTPKSVEGGVGEEQFQEDKNKDVQAFKQLAYDILQQSTNKAASDVLAHIQKTVTMTDIKKELKSDLRGMGINWWTPSQDNGKKKDKCEICCVNKPEKTFDKLTHDGLCGSQIQMCVGCLWNWQYNPIKCHSCDQDKIRSPVGDGWGAILIAGTDGKQDITKRFEDDIEKLKDRVITKATLMGVMNNVVTVKKSNTTYGEQLEKAFNNFDTPEISTIVLVYSGHHGDGNFQLDTYTLTDSELEKKINCLKHVTKVIVFLDCCHPKKLNLGDKAVLQINGVTSQQKAICGQTGSQFVNDIIDVLTKPWECKCCKNTPLIRDYDMHRYFNNHPFNASTEPSQHSYTQGDIDHILTFRPVDSGWMKALDESLESSPVQKLRNELFKLYNKNTSTLRIRLDIDEAVEKVYEEPKLTVKEIGKDKEDDLSEVNDIFRNKEGTMAKTIFVEGEPGSGKSSLCKMIVHDWCETKHDGRTETEGHELLSRFEFVFYIILREAKDECQVKKMILKNIINRIGLDNPSTEELLGDVLKSNTCLLLLDGLDEWQHPERCFFDERIPHVETRWENCIILITTRPYKMAELKISRSRIGKHVMLKGVLNPERLIEKVVSSLNAFYERGQSHDAKGSKVPLNHKICITEIQNKNMSHFGEYPIMLVHIIWLWYKGKLAVDMKQSELYESLLNERWKESCGKRESAGSKYIDVIYALSKIAFQKLFSKDEHSTIVFEIDEKKNPKIEILKSSLKSGILSCSNVPGDFQQYHFLHKTVQEYLAALYLSKYFEKCCLHIKQTYKNNRRESGISLSQMFLFLCGLNSKAAEKLSKVMNELFTDFCDREGYNEWDLQVFQDNILQGTIELERSDIPRGKLCLQHIYLTEFDELGRDEKKATALTHYVTTNQSSVISLHIDDENTKNALHLGKKSDNKVLDLRKFKSLKYLHLNNTTFKDVTGLNLNHLVECRIIFITPQQAPRLTSTFYKSNIKCMKKMKKLILSNLTDLNWLNEGSEIKGIIDMRRLANLKHLTDLGLDNLPYSDVVNLHELRLHMLMVTFNELQQAPQLMSTLSAHGTCQNKREGFFSHLKDVHLKHIRMSEEQFRRLVQSFIKAGGTSLQMWDCSIEPEENATHLQNEREQQVVASECTTNIYVLFGNITVEGFIRLIDYVTRCGQSVEFELVETTLKSNPAVEKTAFPMVAPQPISADNTTKLELFKIDMSTEQFCQIVGRMNQLNHSVTLRLNRCTEISDDYNPLTNQIEPPPSPSQDCTKHIKIENTDISETLCVYVATSAIYCGYTCDISECNILPSEVPHAYNLHFPQMAAIHSPAQTAKLRFHIVSIPQDVVERLASQAAIAGHLVECVLDWCSVSPPPDVRLLKEKMERNPAIQIEKFKFEPNNDDRPNSLYPEGYKRDQIWDIRFKTTAKKSTLTESTAGKPEVTECTRM